MKRRPDSRCGSLAALLGALLLELGGGALGPPPAPAEAAPPATVERIDWESSAKGGRVVVTVRGIVQYSTRSVGADRNAGVHPRAYIDLRPARLGASLSRTPVEVDDVLLERIRVGQFDPQTVRVVVDLREPALFQVRTAENPTRLFLALQGQPGRPAGNEAARAESTQPVAEPRADERRAVSPPAGEQTGSVSPDTPDAPAAAPGSPVGTETARGAAPSAASKDGAPAPGPAASGVAAAPDGAPASAAATVAAAGPSPEAIGTSAGTPRDGGSIAAAPPPPTPPSLAAPSPAATPRRKGAPAGHEGDMSRGESSAPAAGRSGGRSPTTRVVVIDPGHGGKDPGARGVTGDEEKSLTLAIAELVAERLRADSRLRVVLTRSDDRSVTLEQRTAIANAQNADLFVSIHANASENPELAGVETYTLNNTNDRATIRLAAMENGLTLAGASSAERDLAYILSDLLQTGKENESVALAESIQRESVRHLRGRWKGVESLGVKKGPFYVLVGAYMPCVLVEVGFLTHETEGQRIASQRYQRDLAEGIASGIQRFLDSAPAHENL